MALALSEAIRLGAMIRPQAFEFFFNNGGSCAIGAALEAIGAEYEDHGFYVEARFITQFTILAEHAPFPCHCPVESSETIRHLIAHLNDYHHWTRERIADWVEQIEREQEAAQKPAAEEVAVCR